MKTKKLFKWPKEIYIFWLVEFVLGLELIGPVLLVFFKDWGGLNQTQTQSLQSWFTLWIFLLEIPTGVYGDVKGKKHSVILGEIFTILGTLIYTITPNIYLFLLAEFLFAMGIALISGAKEAWMYDTAKRLRITKKFRDISITGSNLHMLGMITASGLFIFVAKILPVHHIFRVGIIFRLISVLLLGVFIKATDGKKKESLKPEYVKTAKEGFNTLRRNATLKSITVYMSILGASGYFIIWLYQEALRVLNIDNSLYGIYRIVLLVAQIVLPRIVALIIRKVGTKKVMIPMGIVVALGFIIGGILRNLLGIFILLTLSGGIALQVPNILSKEINDEISSKQRATVLSFVGMVKRLFLTILNPIMGYSVDTTGVFLTFLILGVISTVSLVFKPKTKISNLK